MTNTWFCLKGNRESGSLSSERLQAMAQAGKFVLQQQQAFQQPRFSVDR